MRGSQKISKTLFNFSKTVLMPALKRRKMAPLTIYKTRKSSKSTTPYKLTKSSRFRIAAILSSLTSTSHNRSEDSTLFRVRLVKTLN